LKKFHLICNAHLDPVWLWEWEEGAAEAVSTFRIAADMCEQFAGFVFNHNEVTLYKWVEEFEPELFERIRRLVAAGRWHIMGGWYLQPDCNMPSAESFVRQMLLGRRYFQEKFGATPTTAINFDSFGHSRGLVQLMVKAGYDSYLFCRPIASQLELPGDDFVWVGYDGSEIDAHRAPEMYNSHRGRAGAKVSEWLEKNAASSVSSLLWGVGNHGGGPSYVDLQQIEALIAQTENTQIVHSTPEAYFRELRDSGASLPRHLSDLNPHAVGCYTSQIRVKQKHRLLENEIYMTEKMLSHAAMYGAVTYPAADLHEALCDLMVSEFHDVLPGSSIQPVEETALRMIDHGLEIVSRLKARAFFALAAGQPVAEEGEIPILVYNPHPYPVEGIWECEFQLADQNWDEAFTMPSVYRGGQPIPSQAEQELSNLNLDWRKRVAFQATLEPSSMNRFDVRLEVWPKKPLPELKAEDGMLKFKSAEMEVDINCATGLVDRYTARGTDYLLPGAFAPIVIADSDDAWGMEVTSFRNVEGRFKLMSSEAGTRFSGVTETQLDSVRVIEDGQARTVVEAVFHYNDSYLVQTYKLPKQGTEFEVQLRVIWNEKSRMLKLSIPTAITEGAYWGQVAGGVDRLVEGGLEAVAQKWTAVYDDRNDRYFACLNDGIHGSDYDRGEIRLSLLRSPGFSGHPILDRTVMPQDRYSGRIDQGERLYRFWFRGGEGKQPFAALDRQALSRNEKPYIVSFFPPGTGVKPAPLAELSDETVVMTACKQAEDGEGYVVRLHNPTGETLHATLHLPAADIREQIQFHPFEYKTLHYDKRHKQVAEASILA